VARRERRNIALKLRQLTPELKLMQSTRLKLKRQAAISAIAQVMQEYAEEIDAYLRQESRYWFDEHPEVDVADWDKTLDDNVPESVETGCFEAINIGLLVEMYDC
jgi:hypothetical protein